ncbi:MAG: heme-binding protein [Deltaproteobacteria bacterium]|nr:heme-binding protein [Deltaproteobacteria bacterium]
MGGALAGAMGVGAAVAALTGSRRAGYAAGGAVALVAGALRWQLQRWFTVQPAYEVERRIGALEIRRYAPRVIARTRVAAGFEHALEEGFHRLAGYIFGGNRAEARIEMTTPVEADEAAGARLVTFTMPPGKSLDNLPHPDDPRVELAELPERRVAVLTFRGPYRADLVEEMERQVRQRVADAGLAGTGEPMFAGYDPPSTLPFLRRVEVWLESRSDDFV